MLDERDDIATPLAAAAIPNLLAGVDRESVGAAALPLPSLRLFTSHKAGATSAPKMYKAASWPEPRKHDAPLEG